jgi:hypothetical protein
MPRNRLLFLTFLLILLTSANASASSLQPQIVTSFGGITYNQTAAWLGYGYGYVPSDMAFAVGPNQLVQVVNGGFEVFSRTGVSLSGQSDVAFWNAAGIATSVTDLGVFDPRVLYDSGTNRFFVTEDVNGGTSNQVLLAVSNDANPLDGFKAVAFTADTNLASGFADFPTLGLDQSGLYIGTNNFDNNTFANSTISIFSIPKSDLLLPGGPSLANMTWFLGDTSLDGIVPNPALDPGGSHGAVLTTGPGTGQAALYTISGSGSPSPSISGALLTGLNDGSIVFPLQSDGSQVTGDIDNRYGATPVAVGNLLYAANMFGDGTTDLVHWMIVDLNSDTVLQQGTISDPNYFYTYPSIAADSAGDFVIGFNRSGATGDSSGYMSAFAVGCHYDGTTATCGTPFEELAGQANSSDGRWGDYSVTVADPTSPGIFWTAQDVTAADGTWTTQITELNTIPEPSTWLLMSAGLGLFLYRRRSISPTRPPLP